MQLKTTTRKIHFSKQQNEFLKENHAALTTKELATRLFVSEGKLQNWYREHGIKKSRVYIHQRKVVGADEIYFEHDKDLATI